jgi:hypothetical protein
LCFANLTVDKVISCLGTWNACISAFLVLVAIIKNRNSNIKEWNLVKRSRSISHILVAEHRMDN